MPNVVDDLPYLVIVQNRSLGGAGLRGWATASRRKVVGDLVQHGPQEVFHLAAAKPGMLEAESDLLAGVEGKS